MAHLVYGVGARHEFTILRPVREFEIGVTLPTSGRYASVDAVARIAAAAEELDFDSVWASEHIAVGSDVADTYARTLDPFSALAFVAGRHERLALGTSVVLLPLHHPLTVAKRAATLHELSRAQFRLGVGVGWYEHEFALLGAPFGGRGARADEAMRLLHAAWAGEREFRGENWTLNDLRFEPLPKPAPEVWVGGSSPRSVRRARELGDVWHPIGAADEAIRAAARDVRVVPRLALTGAREDGDRLRALREVGASGAVIRFGPSADARAPVTVDATIEAMRRFAGDVLPALT